MNAVYPPVDARDAEKEAQLDVTFISGNLLSLAQDEPTLPPGRLLLTVSECTKKR